MIRKILVSITKVFFISGCNTITNTVEGVSRGVYKDVKTTYHYSTCIFTDVQCGDLDLKTNW